MRNKIYYLLLCLLVVLIHDVSPLLAAEQKENETIPPGKQQPAVSEPENNTLDFYTQRKPSFSAPDNETTPKASPEELRKYYTEAFNALRKGEYPYAEKMFEKYIQLNPKNMKIYEYLAQMYLHNEQYIDVIRVLKKALEINPSFVKGLVMIAKAYRESGFYEEALKAYDKALTLDKDLEILFQKGLTLERLNEPDKARKIYETVLKADPFHPEAHFSLGLMEFRDKDYDKALKQVKRAVELEPNNPLYALYLNKIQTEYDLYSKSANKAAEKENAEKENN